MLHSFDTSGSHAFVKFWYTLKRLSKHKPLWVLLLSLLNNSQVYVSAEPHYFLRQEISSKRMVLDNLLIGLQGQGLTIGKIAQYVK